MQRLLYVLFQLDEARRYIEDGRMERLRLALVLLDNAAEIQMDRRIRDDLTHELMDENLRSQVLLIPESERPPILEELAQWKPLTYRQKKDVERSFDQKVKYLTERKPRLDPRLAQPLTYLHLYRNEAYHRAQIRRETIRTAATILLEINCQLLLSMSPGVTSYSSDEDYSWIRERFGKDPARSFLGENDIEAIIEEIRSGVVPSTESVASTLGEHLHSRLEEVYSGLDFIVESLVGVPDREAALKESQYFAEAERGNLDPSTCLTCPPKTVPV